MIRFLEPLMDRYATRTFRVGSTILYQGEVPRAACIVKSGIVRVYSISPQGDDQIVTMHVKGEFFPASWIYQKSTSTLFFYEALTDCEIVFAPRQELVAYWDETAAKRRILLDYFTTNYAASLIRINALEQPKARDKLLYTLYFLCMRYGKYAKTDKKVEIPISLTHQHFASLVGITRETTAMELNKLKKQRVISYKQQRYTVNLEKLSDLVGEETFRDVSISN
ncbi:MAG TPA: Crp/Fnr family transcriptional regulator [Candidatus Saccharibacteria bacterium]|jgi:CRP/FNR family cyclic AMP-dependent transcriptional regulator|nr:Crp/Fnr family transcriptional regulator [Candidatus Saccharibacteria bacterium]HMT55309.1 Crp/Fnr family transcriptional regulator [Candidatus Saccharibacteria bacterium]